LLDFSVRSILTLVFMGMKCDFSSEKGKHGLRMCETGVLRSMLGLSRRY